MLGAVHCSQKVTIYGGICKLGNAVLRVREEERGQACCRGILPIMEQAKFCWSEGSCGINDKFSDLRWKPSTTYYSDLSPYNMREWTCIISHMIWASRPWAHDKNILNYDGWAGRQIIPNGGRWAEVVGYYADGCIKVDVYEIDGWAQTHIKLDWWAKDWWAEDVVWDVVLDGWAEGGIKYRWLYINQIRGGNKIKVTKFLEQQGAKLVLPYEKPSSNYQPLGQLYSEEVINQSFRVPGAAGCLAEFGIQGVKLVLPYETPSSDHPNLGQPYRLPSSRTQELTNEYLITSTLPIR
ncbi:hypothetical protein BDR06DRAFT_971769 [Suillus hirtellus]|nr:hypothetical protein BDR06DRAFT_971769 [Suillus hirtellus]